MNLRAQFDVRYALAFESYLAALGAVVSSLHVRQIEIRDLRHLDCGVLVNYYTSGKYPGVKARFGNIAWAPSKVQ
jgi:hypothetical protein